MHVLSLRDQSLKTYSEWKPVFNESPVIIKQINPYISIELIPDWWRVSLAKYLNSSHSFNNYLLKYSLQTDFPVIEIQVQGGFPLFMLMIWYVLYMLKEVQKSALL